MQALNKIDGLVKELDALKPIKPEWQEKLDKKFRLEFNYNSNHLEGNTLTYGETELLLIFDDTKGNHTMREYEEMKAHDVAYHLVEDWSKDNERPLTEQNIKNLNEIILVRPFWKDAITADGQNTRRQIEIGNYKTHPNSVRLQNGEIFHYASPSETPIQMQEMIDWYRSNENNLHPVVLAAMLHYKFVCIHPFDDGNGRVSRLLMNYVLLKNDLPPIIIQSTDKKNYLRVLHLADVGDIQPFIDYIGEQVIWSLQISIKAAKGEDLEEDGDLDKKIALLDRELELIDGNERVQTRLNNQVLSDIYKSWFIDLIVKLIPSIQKFNKFFIGNIHKIYIPNTIIDIQFSDEVPEKVRLKLLKGTYKLANLAFNKDAIKIFIEACYGAFIKGGLKSFGSNYGIEIQFDTLKYRVLLDEFVESDERKKIILYEKLLHQPLSEQEIDNIVKRFSNTILQHIEFHINKNEIK